MSQKIKLTASAECTTIDNKIEVIVKLTPGAYTVGSNRFTHVTQGGIQANASKIRYIQGSITYEKIFDSYLKINGRTVIDSMTYSEFYNTTGINLTKSFRIEVTLGSPYSTSSKFIALRNYISQNNVKWLSLVSNSTGYEEDEVIITGLTNTSTIMYVYDVKSTHYFDGKINFGINSVTLTGNDYIVQLGDVTKSFTITPTSYTTQVSLHTTNSIFKRFTSLERAPTSNQKFTVNRRDIDVERPYEYYIVIGTNATYTCDYGSSTLYSSTTTSEMYNFYPLTDIVTASAPIALDAGNNLLYVDASKCFSSNMGYTPKGYRISHNTDTNPVYTQSDAGIEFIPHTENRNNVGVDVAVFYDTLEGEEKSVISDEVFIDLRYVSPPSTTTATLTKINDGEYIPIEGSTEDKAKLRDVLTFQIPEPCSYILGDVNGDGVVDNKDSGLLMKYLNNWTVQINKAAADVNGDGKINNDDYSLIQQYLNGRTTSSIGHRFITTDAFEIIPHITMKNGITKSFKLDKELNSHLNGYYFESGHKGFMNENLDNYDCGGYIKTEITNANITNHYPSPIPLKNKPLSEFNIVKWDGTTANSFASGSGTEDDPYIIETPSQLSWMCSGAGSTEWNSTTFGKYYKIADGIDAFDLCGHSGVTLETSAAQLKSISSDGIYNINHASNNWFNDNTKKSQYFDGIAFAGTFDANGCIIFNMFAAGSAPSLFPWIGIGATVKNLILKNCRSWQWNAYSSTQPPSGFLYGGMDNGAGYNDGNNPNYNVRQTNTNIKFENCIVCGCYGSSYGISRHLVGGLLRYVNMKIDNCLFVDNILEVSNKSSTTKDDLYMFGGLIGGSYDPSIAPDTTLKVNGCVIIGDSVMPQIINTSSIYPSWQDGYQVSDWLTNNSNNYINCYRSVESSDDYILSSKINNLIESQMRNSNSEIFMTDLDWITPNWYSVNPTTTDVLNSDELYIKINTGEPLKLYNEDGTIENYILKKNDKVFIEVRSYTYENSTYMVDASEDSRNSRPVILHKGIIIPVKVENEDGTSAYKCGTIFVKTPSGYKEGSSMFIKNINNYMEV